MNDQLLAKLWKHASFSRDPMTYVVSVFLNEETEVEKLTRAGFLTKQEGLRRVRFTPRGADRAREIEGLTWERNL